MVFTPIEIIALVMIVLGAIKMIVLLVKPKAWMNFAKGVYSKPSVVKVVGFILGVIVLYYLLSAGITIVQILAVTAFVALLFMIGLVEEIDYFLKKYEELIKKGTMWKDYWFYTLLWIILMVWGAWKLFA
jgi:hypothetical protein|tara:strand:+ start:297 stop:686 length:390 start_codon:yes stop_codon:yes gene_type:complete